MNWMKRTIIGLGAGLAVGTCTACLEDIAGTLPTKANEKAIQAPQAEKANEREYHWTDEGYVPVKPLINEIPYEWTPKGYKPVMPEPKEATDNTEC